MFLPSVIAVSPTLDTVSPTRDTRSFIANSLQIQTGKSSNGYIENPDWTLRTGTGVRTYRVAVEFDSPFSVVPKVSLALSGMDVDGVNNNRLSLTAENITVNGFDIVYITWYDTIVYGAYATWIAIGAL
jgi:hypothetical protein